MYHQIIKYFLDCGCLNNPMFHLCSMCRRSVHNVLVLSRKVLRSVYRVVSYCMFSQGQWFHHGNMFFFVALHVPYHSFKLFNPSHSIFPHISTSFHICYHISTDVHLFSHISTHVHRFPHEPDLAIVAPTPHFPESTRATALRPKARRPRAALREHRGKALGPGKSDPCLRGAIHGFFPGASLQHLYTMCICYVYTYTVNDMYIFM